MSKHIEVNIGHGRVQSLMHLRVKTIYLLLYSSFLCVARRNFESLKKDDVYENNQLVRSDHQ